MFSWYKYLIVSLVFSRLGFWSGSLFLIAPFPDLCLLVLSQSLSEGFRYINGFLGTVRTVAIKVARSQEELSMKKRESVKLKESIENAKPRPMGHQQLP